MQVKFAAKTEVGRVRKKNEDRCGYDERAGIFVVCDGMGGEAAGEVAAELALRTILNYYGRSDLGGNLEADLRSAIQLANTAIREVARSDVRYKKMGSTIVAASTRGDSAAVANVGDSRGYLLRDGAIRQVTTDHSLVAEQVRRGLLKEEDLEKSPWKNIVTRTLGGKDDVEPDVALVDLRPGDTLLVATDGVTKSVPDPKLREIVASANSLDAACELLIKSALDNGSDDNTTCLLLHFEKTPWLSRAHSGGSGSVILGS